MSQTSKSGTTDGALDDSGEASYTSHGKDLNFQQTVPKTVAPKEFRRLKKGVTLDRSVDIYDSDEDVDEEEGQLTIRGDSQNIVKQSVAIAKQSQG
ncbi:hypothetical protein Ddc_09892 [Ditylenchus destructor]|nr:hypothetical protein Ddc_09892 [Ditylenchus destructor]